MSRKKLLASVSESLNDHIRLCHAYSMAVNRILYNQIDGRAQLTDSERKVVVLSAVRPGQIRDGPVQRCPQLDGQPPDGQREAA